MPVAFRSRLTRSQNGRGVRRARRAGPDILGCLHVSTERARHLAGLKGNVTNLPATTLDGHGVVAAHHDLWQVEHSFRMAKSDLPARPIFHRERDAIEAHLTIVFTALAVSRHLQDATGVTIKKLVRTLRPLRTVRIDVGGHPITAAPQITSEARALLDRIPAIAAPGH
jgi:hypothetical protein